MPARYQHAYRPSAAQDEVTTKLSREAIRRSSDMLRDHPSPDTFLGRKTQEPFPREEDEPAT